MDDTKNQNCLLREAGLKPFRRCNYCEGPLLRCFSFQFTVVSLFMLVIMYFLVDITSTKERFLMAGVVLLWALLVFLVSKETDKLVEAEYRTREAFREKAIAEERHRRLFEDATDAIYIIEPETGRILDCNKRVTEMLGYTKEELLNMTLYDINPASEGSNITKRIESQLGGQELRFQTIHITKDGKTIEVEVTSKMIEWDHRKVLMGFVRDITLRKEAERQQADLLKLLNETIENMPDGIFLIDKDHTVVLANPHARECLKLCGVEGPGDHLHAIEGRPLEEFLTSPPEVYYHEVRPGERIFEIGGRRLKTNILDGYIFLVRDVTERKKREEKIFRQEKLASLGQLASGIAHDFRNILSIIMGAAENLSEKIPSDMAENELEAILQSTQRATSMIEQILTFTRTKTEEQSPIHLKETLQTFSTFIKRLLPRNITLDIEIKSPEAVVLGSENMLYQALANLVINSRDAMPEGGTITITLNEAEFSEKDVPFEEMLPGRWVVLEVKDKGSGISEDILEHIFEPFFTTKKEGTGLGLAQVYGIVNQHGGFIDVTSKIGIGTKVTIYLPKFKETEMIEPVPYASALPEGQGEKVLLVEDEKELAEMIASDLRRHGYTVEMAEEGRKALALIEQDGFSLVITDLMMPGMGGITLIDQLRKQRPELKIIIITGYTVEGTPDGTGAFKDLPVLRKPFSLKMLRLEIARALRRV